MSGASDVGGCVKAGHWTWASCSDGEAPVPPSPGLAVPPRGCCWPPPGIWCCQQLREKGGLLRVPVDVGRVQCFPCDSRCSLTSQDLNRGNQRSHSRVWEGGDGSQQRQLFLWILVRFFLKKFVHYFSIFYHLLGTGWLHRRFKYSYLGDNLSSAWGFPIVEMLEAVTSLRIRGTLPSPTISPNDIFFLWFLIQNSGS